VGAINDPGALGALRAFEEAGRGADCPVMGHNGVVEARAELRRRGTSLIGTVAYFPERYGATVVKLAMALLAGGAVPPAARRG
jgi:ribose transport system substrate-binding protein